VAFSGVLPAAILLAGAGFSAASLAPSTDPPVWPTLPLVPALAILFAALPAIVAPIPLHRPRAASKLPVVATEPIPVRPDPIEIPA
jgi:energy-coupling factor transport system permease protein